MKKIVVPAVLALTMLAQPVYAQSNAEGVRSEVAVETVRGDVSEGEVLKGEREDKVDILKKVGKYIAKKAGEAIDAARGIKVGDLTKKVVKEITGDVALGVVIEGGKAVYGETKENNSTNTDKNTNKKQQEEQCNRQCRKD